MNQFIKSRTEKPHIGWVVVVELVYHDSQTWTGCLMGVCAWRCFYLLWSSCLPEFVVFIVIVVDTQTPTVWPILLHLCFPVSSLFSHFCSF